MGIVAFFALLLVAQSSYSAAQDLDACMARAMAATDPENAISEAVATSVATAVSDVIDCGAGSGPNAEQVSGLAVAFSLAISETRAATENCVAEAIATAEDVPGIVGEAIKMMVKAGVLSEVDGAYRTMADAWFAAREWEIMRLVERRERQRGWVELASLIGEAVRGILEAVQCGVNLESNEKECSFESGKFVGLCIEPKATGPQKTPDCKGDFKNCIRGQDPYHCYYKFIECMRSLATA
ncbi:hypothetical protein BSKO_10436 [Bryopsis sp. KO-2023]|nr:hypothetical protein BSKO_10436 [Bryopsis sp. KO-2023]